MIVSGGFYITQSIQRPAYSNPRLLPKRVVTASRCITKFLPDTWCIEWTNDCVSERKMTAEYFGLNENEMYSLISEMTAAFDSSLDWPNTIRDLKFARSIADSFLADEPDIRILELGLHSEYVRAMCEDMEPEQHAGFAPVGRQGIHEAILRMQQVSRTGMILGFEPLLSNHSIACSWLCNGLETEVAEHLAILPNANGLIDTFEEAQAAVSYIGRDEVGAEPGLWLPWLIIDHTKLGEIG